MKVCTKIISQPKGAGTTSAFNIPNIKRLKKATDKYLKLVKKQPTDKKSLSHLNATLNGLIEEVAGSNGAPSQNDRPWIDELSALFPAPQSTKVNYDAQINRFNNQIQNLKRAANKSEDSESGPTLSEKKEQIKQFQMLVNTLKKQKKAALANVPTSTQIGKLLGNLKLLRAVVKASLYKLEISESSLKKLSIAQLSGWRDVVLELKTVIDRDGVSESTVIGILDLLGKNQNIFTLNTNQELFKQAPLKLSALLGTIIEQLTTTMNELIAKPAEEKLNSLFEHVLATGKVKDVGLLQEYVPNTLRQDAVLKLDILLESLGADESTLNGLSVQDKWLSLVGYVNKVEIKPGLLLELVPNGPSGEALDQLVETFSRWGNTAFVPQLQQFVGMLRTKKKNATNLFNQQRWASTEIRLGEILKWALDQCKTVPSQKTQEAIIETIEKYKEDCSRVCSVGADLRLLNLKADLNRILSTDSAAHQIDSLKIHLTEWSLHRIVEILRRVISDYFAGSVHNINLTAIQILKKMGHKGDLTALQDYYRASAHNAIMDNAEKIHRFFTDPSQLIVSVARYLKPDQDNEAPIKLDAALGHLSESKLVGVSDSQFSLTAEQHYKLAVLVFKKLTVKKLEVLLNKNSDSRPKAKKGNPLKENHQKLVEQGLTHGLAGIVVQEAPQHYDQIQELIDVKKVDQADVRGMTLLMYAVRGGDAGVIESVWYLNEESQLKGQIGVKSELPNILGLAAESGSEPGFKMIVSLLKKKYSSEEILTLLTTPDSKGYTPLMRAILSKNEALVMVIIGALRNGLSKPNFLNALSWKNKAGQTALMLAVSESLDLVTQEFLRAGVNPNDKNLNGQTALHLAVIYNHCEIARRLAFCSNFNHDDYGYSPLNYLSTSDMAYSILEGLVYRTKGMTFLKAFNQVSSRSYFEKRHTLNPLFKLLCQSLLTTQQVSDALKVVLQESMPTPDLDALNRILIKERPGDWKSIFIQITQDKQVLARYIKTSEYSKKSRPKKPPAKEKESKAISFILDTTFAEIRELCRLKKFSKALINEFLDVWNILSRRKVFNSISAEKIFGFIEDLKTEFPKSKWVAELSQPNEKFAIILRKRKPAKIASLAKKLMDDLPKAKPRQYAANLTTIVEWARKHQLSKTQHFELMMQIQKEFKSRLKKYKTSKSAKVKIKKVLNATRSKLNSIERCLWRLYKFCPFFEKGDESFTQEQMDTIVNDLKYLLTKTSRPLESVKDLNFEDIVSRYKPGSDTDPRGAIRILTFKTLAKHGFGKNNAETIANRKKELVKFVLLNVVVSGKANQTRLKNIQAKFKAFEIPDRVMMRSLIEVMTDPKLKCAPKESVETLCAFFIAPIVNEVDELSKEVAKLTSYDRSSGTSDGPAVKLLNRLNLLLLSGEGAGHYEKIVDSAIDQIIKRLKNNEKWFRKFFHPISNWIASNTIAPKMSYKLAEALGQIANEKYNDLIGDEGFTRTVLEFQLLWRCIMNLITNCLTVLDPRSGANARFTEIEAQMIGGIVTSYFHLSPKGQSVNNVPLHTIFGLNRSLGVADVRTIKLCESVMSHHQSKKEEGSAKDQDIDIARVLIEGIVTATSCNKKCLEQLKQWLDKLEISNAKLAQLFRESSIKDLLLKLKPAERTRFLKFFPSCTVLAAESKAVPKKGTPVKQGARRGRIRGAWLDELSKNQHKKNTVLVPSVASGKKSDMDAID